VGKRTRITRKSLKHDALLETASATTRFIEEHLNKILMAAVGVVVVVLVVAMVVRARRATELAASAALVTAQQTMNAGLLTQAAEQLQTVISQYPGTRSAGAAACYLGALFYQQGQHDQALVYFDDYLNSDGSPTLRRAALEGKAAIHEDRREFAAAAAIFREIASEYPDSPTGHWRALQDAIRCYRSDGDWASVRDAAREMLDTYPDSAYVGEARAVLAEAQVHLGT